MKRHTRYWMGLLIAAAVALLVGCGQTSAPASTGAPETKPAAGQQAAPAAAQPAASALPAELRVPDAWIEAAKKEGKVRVMSTEENDESVKIVAAFNKRYPFIQVEYTNAPTAMRQTTALQSAAAGKPVADFVTGIGGVTADYLAAGVLTDISDLPIYKVYPEAMKWEGKYLAGPYSRNWLPAYNTNLVKRDELPRTWNDLLDPKWKGQVASSSITKSVSWVPLWHHWGKDQATAWLQGMKANGLIVRSESSTQALNLLAAGEQKILLTSGVYDVYGRAKAAKMPVDIIPMDVVPRTSGGLLAVMKSSPYPNAAKIWVNWLMSKEGQQIFCEATGSFPVHPELQELSCSMPSDQWVALQKNSKFAVRTLQHEVQNTRGSDVNTTWDRLVR